MNNFSYDIEESENSILDKKVASVYLTLKILSEENRINILSILLSSPLCVSELQNILNLSQSLVSHHLRDLKDLGLVQSEKNGKWVFYSLTDKGRKIYSLIESF